MEEFIFPPGPSVSRPSMLKCTPDGHLLVCNNDLTVIRSVGLNKLSTTAIDVKPVGRPNCVAVNEVTYNNPHCYASICGSNKYIILVDLKQNKRKQFCAVHIKDQFVNDKVDRIVATCFVNDDILFVTESGHMGEWKTYTNNCQMFNRFLRSQTLKVKIQVTCMVACPHRSKLIAIGLRCGLVLLADLNKPFPHAVRKFHHGHNEIYSVSWCPAPFNILKVDEEKLRLSESETLDDSSKDRKQTIDWYEMARSSYESSLNNSSESRENRHSEQLDAEDDVDGSSLTVDEDLKFVPVENADVSFSCDIIQYEERDPSTVKPPVITDKKNPWSNGVQSNVTEVVEDCDDKFLEDCATLKNILRDEDEIVNHTNDTYLFLSTSSVGDLRVWDALGEKSLVLSIHQKNRQQNKKYFEFPATWLNERIIVFSCSHEIRFFDMKQYNDFTSLEIFHVDHNEPVFCVTVPYKPVSLDDLKSGPSDISDMQIWSLDVCNVLVRLPFDRCQDKLIMYSLCKSVINRFSVSPIDHHNVAFCSQTSFFTLWKINEVNPYKCTMTNVRVKSTGPTTILCIAHHPEIDYSTAVSLSNGCIKTCNLSLYTPKIRNVRDVNSDEVYSISWGPYQTKDFPTKICIYAAVNGKIQIYDPDNEHPKTPFGFRTGDGVTTVSWNRELDRLAVGLADGCVSFYDGSLQYLVQTYFCKSFIFRLVWHPASADDRNLESKLKTCIAVVAKDKYVYVFDPESSHMEIVVAVLKGHEHYVYDACWSPYASNLLVTASADYTAKVWDVLTETQLSSFNEHGNELYSVCWFPTHPEFIMSSGLDTTLRVWNYKKHPPQFEPLELRKKKFNKTKDIVPLSAVEIMKDDNKQTLVSVAEPLEVKEDDSKPMTVSLSSTTNDKPIIDDIPIATTKKTLNSHNNAAKDHRLLHLCYNQDQDQILNASNHLLDPNPENNNNILNKFFSDDFDDLYDLLNIEQDSVVDKHRNYINDSINVWRSKIEKSIEKSRQDDSLSEKLVSLAPMVSHELWSTTCYHYSKQCLRRGHISKAVDYLLAIHKTQEAINVYLNVNMYREAYILAKCHISLKDPILNTILDKWVKYSLDTGCYEMAALCLIKLGEYDKSAKLLSKRVHKRNVLELALKVAERTTDKDLVNTIRLQLSKMATVDPVQKNGDICNSRFQALTLNDNAFQQNEK